MNSAGRQDSVRDVTGAQRRGRRGGDPRESVLQGHQAEGPVTRHTLFGDQQGLRGVDVAGSRWVPRWRSESLGGGKGSRRAGLGTCARDAFPGWRMEAPGAGRSGGPGPAGPGRPACSCLCLPPLPGRCT